MKEIKLIIPDDVIAASITIVSSIGSGNVTKIKVHATAIDGSDVSIKWNEDIDNQQKT